VGAEEQLEVMRLFTASYHYRADGQAKNEFLITNSRFRFFNVRGEWQLSIPAGGGYGSSRASHYTRKPTLAPTVAIRAAPSAGIGQDQALEEFPASGRQARDSYVRQCR
jgi:hypothetical protein